MKRSAIEGSQLYPYVVRDLHMEVADLQRIESDEGQFTTIQANVLMGYYQYLSSFDTPEINALLKGFTN